MWFPLGFQNFAGKKKLNADSCDIYICDFNRIWHASLSNNEILSISKALNPLLEASVQKLKDVIIKLLQDGEVQKEIKQVDDNILLKLQSNIMGVKFQFEVLLETGDEDLFYKEFTLPLLLLLINFQKREKKLMKIIQDKDAEIEDYKQEYGGKTNYLATKRFNEEEFNCQELEPNIYWNPNSLLDCISSKLSCIETGLKTGPKVEEDEQSVEKDSGTKYPVNICDKNKTIFRDKSFNVNSGFKPCVFLENQTIKKRKMHNDGFKIKF